MSQMDEFRRPGSDTTWSSLDEHGKPCRVLHVEDDEDAAQLVRHLLTLQRTMRVERLDRVATKAAALAAVTDDGPYDVVLLDLHLPDNRDVEIVDHLVAHGPTAAVIVLTADDQEHVGIQALRRGAMQFLSKRQLDEDLLGRELLFAVARKTYELRLRRLTRTDELTGLANRRAVADYYQLAQERLARDDGSIVVAYYDLNHFKTINDLYGHLTGDAVLRTVARHLLQEIRTGDLVARLSGDEFVVMGIATDGSETGDFANRLSQFIDELPIGIGDATITAARGVIITDGTRSLEDVLALADRTMYEHKHPPGH